MTTLADNGGRPTHTTYDRIGSGYQAIRRPDVRLAQLIAEALHPAASVVNVGAGTGSYGPRDVGYRLVVGRPRNHT